MREAVIGQVLKHKIIAIVRGIKRENSLRLAQALLEGGIRLIEFTFAQSEPESFHDTAESIAAVNARFGEDVLAGAGTVTSPELVRMAADAGARYIIAPDTNADVIMAARAAGLVSMPGALTPSEILAAHSAGADFVKLFPVSNLGPAYIKAIRAPISHVKLLAVGGVNENNIREYLEAGCVGAGVGGSLVSKKLVEAGEFGKITELARTYIRNIAG